MLSDPGVPSYKYMVARDGYYTYYYRAAYYAYTPEKYYYNAIYGYRYDRTYTKIPAYYAYTAISYRYDRTYQTAAPVYNYIPAYYNYIAAYNFVYMWGIYGTYQASRQISGSYTLEYIYSYFMPKLYLQKSTPHMSTTRLMFTYNGGFAISQSSSNIFYMRYVGHWNEYPDWEWGDYSFGMHNVYGFENRNWGGWATIDCKRSPYNNYSYVFIYIFDEIIYGGYNYNYTTYLATRWETHIYNNIFEVFEYMGYYASGYPTISYYDYYMYNESWASYTVAAYYAYTAPMYYYRAPFYSYYRYEIPPYYAYTAPVYAYYMYSYLGSVYYNYIAAYYAYTAPIQTNPSYYYYTNL